MTEKKYQPADETYPSRMARRHGVKNKKSKIAITTENDPSKKNELPKSKKEGSTQETMVQSTIWLTIGNIVSRLLGALYVIPWYMWMQPHGEAANYLYTKGYNVYALFLMISTAGIPAAVAKQTAHYNSLNEYALSKKLLMYTLKIMFVAGIIATFLMFFGAPLLSQGNADLVPVMRSLSLVLLIFPCMSVIRGFFQGNNDMRPYAMSQLIEQIARVAYMLITAFMIMKVFDGSYKHAVVQSTFAAFIGVVFAMLVLLANLVKKRPAFQEQIAESSNQLNFSGRELVIQMVKQAIPFIVIGGGTSIFKLIDQYTFEKIMSYVTNYSKEHLETLFALISANPDKLTMVVISLATSMAVAGLPLITAKFTTKDHAGLAKLVTNNLTLFFFVMLPATIGMIILAYPLNTIFYRPNPLGSALLAASCVTGVMMGLFMISSTMLQGLNGNKPAMVYLFIGVAVKLITQIPLTAVFHEYGPIMASFIGFLATCAYTIDKIHQISRFPFRDLVRSVGKITGMTIIMGIFAFGAYLLATRFFSIDSKTQSFIVVMLVAAVGGGVYLYMALKTRMADQLLGERIGGLRTKLHIK